MTAAALANRLAESDSSTAGSSGEIVGFTEEVARISRAQFAAVLGNLIFVIPMVFVLDLLWRGLHGSTFYSIPKAGAAIESISLIHSGTIVYAALTGVILWVSSIGAGFAENFVVFMRVKEIVAGNRMLKRFFGSERARLIGEGIVRNATGVVSSFLLGFLLAGTPIMAQFFGIPLDVRHVTLTTGTLTFSFIALGTFQGGMLALASILVIALLNFGVSFGLAIMTALRARNANLKRAAVLFRTSRRAFFARPWIFFFPPKGPHP
jgi:site-specific recombinase